MPPRVIDDVTRRYSGDPTIPFLGGSAFHEEMIPLADALRDALGTGPVVTDADVLSGYAHGEGAVKAALDPAGIFNPGKVLDPAPRR